MNDIKVVSNNQWRHFLYFHELTSKEQKEIKSDYDYMSNEEIECSTWIRYKKDLYNLSDFMDLNNKVHNPVNPFDGQWDGQNSQGYNSGLVIKISDCNEAYKIGYY